MRSPRELIEIKTAGLLSPYALDGWTTDTVPLTYEIQCRWQMHVTGADVVHLVGLVPGFGVSVWDIDRDEDTEQQLVAAVDDWWHTHVVAGKEPPFSPSDSDVMNGRWSQTTPDAVALDATDIVPILEARREAAAQERAAAERKRELDAAIKALLGDHEAGMYAGDVVVTWGWESGRVSTQKAAAAGIDLEPFRGKPHRVLRIKEVA
jgi:predicted phage-related endonuclease